MTEPPVELTYGRQAPKWRRKRYWVLGGIVIVSLAVGFLVRQRVKSWYDLWVYRQEAARWYASALNWSEPPTKLKYTENPADAPGSKFLRFYNNGGTTRLIGFKTFGGAPQECRPMFNTYGQPILARGPDEIMLFLHQRTTPGGLTRLVAACSPHFDLSAPPGKSLLGIDTNLIGPLNGDYRILKGNYRLIDMTGVAAPGEIRIFAGQCDPKDASRFSIPFEARGKFGLIEGQFIDGPSFSKDPANAKLESEINSGIELTVRMIKPPIKN